MNLLPRLPVLFFWSSALTVAYPYVIFPLLVAGRAMLRPRSVKRGPITPSLSVIVAAHNEEAVIERKIRNFLDTNYPEAQRELIIASDGSTDRTNEIVRNHANPQIKLIQRPREGKIPAINAAAAEARGDILVFTDANSQFEQSALQLLVAYFADPEVGGVAGDQRYVRQTGGNDGEATYWNFDRLLKSWESRAGSVVSATGAIYAIRRSLFTPAPIGVTDDFMISTGVVVAGHRLVFAPDAIAYETLAASSRAEFSRKVRIMTQGLQGVAERRALLNPARFGFYAVQLFSHKLLRRLAVLPLAVMAVSSVLLSSRSPMYRLVAIIQAVGYGAGLLALAFPTSAAAHFKPAALLGFFCMVNSAALLAIINILRGRRIGSWQPSRPDK